MKSRFIIRRLVGPLIICSLLFIPVVMATLAMPQKVEAQGETCTFAKQGNDTVIICTGGSIFPDPITGNRRLVLTQRSGNVYHGVDRNGGSTNYTLTVNQRIAGAPGTGEATYYNGQMVTTTLLNNPGATYAIQIRDPNNLGPSASSLPGNNEPEEEEKEPIDCPIEPNQEGRQIFCYLLFVPLTKATNVLDSVLNEYLSTGNAIFEDDELEEKYKTAWSVFRNFGIGLLVIAGLVMLISEALSLSIIDAYTVRKVLPRLLVAIIGISISWELTKFLINFFDDLGAAMGNIIYTSFDIGVGDLNITEQVVAALLAGGGITTVALTLGSFGILSLFGTLLLAMLVGAVVLILRQAIIVAAILLAPLAIAAYVLPNTNKLANFWWDTFIRMLMLYPIATGVIALAKVLGNITMDAPTSGSTLEGIISLITGMIFFIGGYALIPLAFRLTGGLVATIGGLANDRTRGGFDRLKNYRKNKSAENIGKMKTGTRFQGNMLGTRNMAKGFNALSVRAATGTRGHFGVGERGRQAVSQAREQAMLEQVMKNPSWNTVNQNDDALMMLSYDNQAEARAGARAKGWSDQRTNSAIGAARASVGFGAAQKLAAARQLVSTGTGYADQHEMAETLARASSGNESQMASLAGFANAETKKVGRFDLAPSFSNLHKLVRAESGRGSFADVVHPETQRPAASADEAYHMTTRAAWNSTSLYSLVNGKEAQTKAFAQHWRNQVSKPISASRGTHEYEEQINARNDAAIALIEMQNALPSAAAGNQKVINEIIASTGYNGTNTVRDRQTGVVRPVELAEHLATRYGTRMNDRELQTSARVIDYGNRGAAAAAGSAAASGAHGVGGPPGGGP